MHSLLGCNFAQNVKYKQWWQWNIKNPNQPVDLHISLWNVDFLKK